MKHGMLLILVFSLLGCQDILDPDSSDNETQPSDSWIKHEGFQGLDSTTYMARVTGDKLTVQRPYGISWIYADNTRDHWRNSYFRSDNVIGNIIGDTYMAIPQKDMTGFEYHTHEFHPWGMDFQGHFSWCNKSRCVQVRRPQSGRNV